MGPNPQEKRMDLRYILEIESARIGGLDMGRKEEGNINDDFQATGLMEMPLAIFLYTCTFFIIC